MTHRVACKYHLAGICSKGDDCHFSHDKAKDMPSTVCRYYLQGHCAYGDRCRYDHARPPHLRPMEEPRTQASSTAGVRPNRTVTAHPTVLPHARLSPSSTHPVSGANTAAGADSAAEAAARTSHVASPAPESCKLSMDKHITPASSSHSMFVPKAGDIFNMDAMATCLPIPGPVLTHDTSSGAPSTSTAAPVTAALVADSANQHSIAGLTVDQRANRPHTTFLVDLDHTHGVVTTCTDAAVEWDGQYPDDVKAAFNDEDNGFADAMAAYGYPDANYCSADGGAWQELHGLCELGNEGGAYNEEGAWADCEASYRFDASDTSQEGLQHRHQPHVQEHEGDSVNLSFGQHIESPSAAEAGPSGRPGDKGTAPYGAATDKQLCLNSLGGGGCSTSTTAGANGAWGMPLTESVVTNGKEGGGDMMDPAEVQLCVQFMMYGSCAKDEDCPLIHGDVCEVCQKHTIHPYNPESAAAHHAECGQRLDKQQAWSASANVECGICLEKVMQKAEPQQRKFGLMTCNHPFCLGCIRGWRASHGADLDTALRTCPICRVTTHFVTPSLWWPRSQAEKEQVISAYTSRLRTIDCRNFDFGAGNCPFGTSCFYRHAYRNGDLEEVSLRRCGDSEGAVHVVQPVRLSNFLTTPEAQRLLSRRP